ncbi:tripartite tricarboxylate transporter substrate-binding protein [Comamonas thiooxydans]|uniref:tripartite tricarboxylate transporter substrate-binding protein n=1 Tax=Comamonas thiooxydans TaxID=363952 RepID=UPI0009B91A0B|nr:tripartite tricarboxylate transporter substrate-binding protein [Comamonas thiooxydans]
MLNRRLVIQTFAAVVSHGSLTRAVAQESNVLKVVNGFPAGGVVDTVSRRVGDGIMATGYAKSVVVDNRVGAAGRIACAAVKAAAPDGNTLLLTPDTALSLYPFIYNKLDYDPFRDFRPVSIAALTTDALAVGPMVPDKVKTVRDFMSWAKANPQHASFGSPGTGSPLHLLGSLLSKEAGVQLTHVPYRGAVPGVADLVGGQIAAMVAPTGNFLNFQQSGKLRILATSGLHRTPFTPENSTFAEQRCADGYPVEAQWFGFFAPATTSDVVVKEVNKSIAHSLRNKSVVESLATYGLVTRGSTPEDMTDSLRKQHENWGLLVKRIGFTAES